MRRLILVSLAAIVLTPGAALGQFMLGAQGSRAEDTDWGIGGRVTLGVTAGRTTNLDLVASFDWFFPDTDPAVEFDYWEVNANVNYILPVQSNIVRTYIGAGLNIAHSNVSLDGPSASDTELGLNLLGGLRGAGRINPFGEVRIELGGGEQFILTAGVNFVLSPI